MFVKCKDSIRDVQSKSVRSLKKKDGLATDTAREVEQQIIAVADGYINEAEKILQSKQTELVGKDWKCTYKSNLVTKNKTSYTTCSYIF